MSKDAIDPYDVGRDPGKLQAYIGRLLNRALRAAQTAGKFSTSILFDDMAFEQTVPAAQRTSSLSQCSSTEVKAARSLLSRPVI